MPVPEPSLLGITPSDWEAIVDAHVELWRKSGRRAAKRDRASWDILLCWLEHEAGSVLIGPAKCLAPFSIPQKPADGWQAHFEEMFDNECRLATIPFDTYGMDEPEGEGRHTFYEDVEALRVRALVEALKRAQTQGALDCLGEQESFGIYWAPQSDSGQYVHLRRIQGPALPDPEPATTAFAALAPLYWHAHSFVGRYHVGLVFEDQSEELVEATLAGPNVTDETLALLTAERAACCDRLRSLTFDRTRATDVAVARVRGLLPNTKVHVVRR